MVGYLSVLWRALKIEALCIPAFLLALASIEVMVVAVLAICLAAVLSPLTFLGRFHPVKEFRWGWRAYRDGYIPIYTPWKEQDRAFIKAWEQWGGPPPPLACPYDRDGPYEFKTADGLATAGTARHAAADSGPDAARH